MTGEPRGFSPGVAGFSKYDGEFRTPLVLAQGSHEYLVTDFFVGPQMTNLIRDHLILFFFLFIYLFIYFFF